MKKENSVMIETDVGKLTWQPASDCCELLTREFMNEDVSAMQVSGFAELKEILKGVLPPLIFTALHVEHKIKEHFRIAAENARAIEEARRKGFLAMQTED